MATAIGNVSASLIQASVSIVGLGALLISSQTIFSGVKWAGAIYLIFIGVQTFIAGSTISTNNQSPVEAEEPKELHSMFLNAFLVAMGNPKAILFFAALFPQFINLKTISLVELVGAMVQLAFIAFICFMIYAIGGEKVVLLFKGNRAGRLINKIIGAEFIGSGVALLIKK